MYPTKPYHNSNPLIEILPQNVIENIPKPWKMYLQFSIELRDRTNKTIIVNMAQIFEPYTRVAIISQKAKKICER